MPSTANPQPPGSRLRPGDLFAERYRIGGLLGGGPYSTVYRAEDTLTNESVALKLIGQPSARDNAVVQQYRLELNLLRQIHHRALVRTLESGEYLGRLYVAMELVEGSTLRDHLRTVGRVPIDQFIRFFSDVSDALGQVHAEHIIHRNIHPGNIMLTRSGGWKLMDFGIARDAPRKPGSPGYGFAAPEQLMGQPLSFAADIYALGAVSYEMLTGRKPHPYGQAAQASRLFPEGEIAGAPPGLASLIETCLHVDSAKRFQNVEALKSAGGQIFSSGKSAASGRRRLQELQMETAADPQEMVALFERVVGALISLHNAGRSHNELSPQNIWVNGESIDIEGSSKISASPGQSTLLISDARYTAPELIMARSAPDQAAHVCGDIYVLGFLFYELLAGKKEMHRQFSELEQMQTGLAWMRWHADRKLKLRPLAEVSPQCPKSLIELIEQMAEKEPSQRIRTLEEIAETLNRMNVRLARTESLCVSPPVIPGKSKRLSTVITVTLTTALILLGVIAVGRWLVSGGWQSLANLIPQGTSGRAPDRPSPDPQIIHTSTGAMMLVPEGEFVMGDDSVPDQAPAHRVKLPAYYIDRLEVSNRNYREFCARSGHKAPRPPSWEPGYHSKDDYPVVNVGRDEAAAFCEAVGKRLPSEEEWEKAARGSEEPVVLWGNWTLPGLANLMGNGAGHPSAVGSFTADVSPFGILDVAGNVQEWVAGEYKLYPANPGTASPPELGQGIVRGGSFRTPPQQLSPSWRGPLPLNAVTLQFDSVGFRCAIDAPAALGRDRLRIQAAR